MNMEEQNKRVYVVTVNSYQQSKEDSEDIVDNKYGILRIFANKDDAFTYMETYYKKLHAEYKRFKTDESSKGWFDAEIHSDTENPKSAISMSGHDLGERIQKDLIKCRTIEITSNLDIETMNIDDDYYEEFFG